LSPKEAELWARVTASIRPLSRETVEAKPVVESQGPAPTQVVAVKAKTPAPVRTKPPESRSARPGTTLDGTWDRKLRSGSLQPDRIVDLHGLNLDGAWRAIDLELERAENA